MNEEQTAEQAFVSKAMALVRRGLYPDVSDAVFAREWPDLIMGVSEPASFMHERGAKLPGSRYLAILKGVIDGIMLDGSAQRSRYRPMYFRRCVQQHMRFQGEKYLDEAKGLQSRQAGQVAAILVKKMRATVADPEAERLTAALVAARGLIAAPRTRK